MSEFYYEYSAVNAQNQIINGKTDLDDRSSVIAALAKQNLKPIRIIKKQKRFANINLDRIFGTSSVKTDSLVIFTRQLSTMVGAGVPLLRALNSLYKYTEDKALKAILETVTKHVEGGMPLGDAFSKHPTTFNDIYVNMVRAGESAGILEDILKRLALQQERSTAIRKKTKSAMAYPMVLMVITTLAFFGLMIFVVPRIGEIVKDLGGPNAELPGITLFMLSVSDFMVRYWYIVAFGLIGLIIAIIAYVRTPKGKYRFDSLMLRTPILGKLVKKMAVARFSRTFSSLMGAGVAVLQALDVTSRAIGNSLFAKSLEAAANEVKSGRTLSTVIEADDLFPGIVSQMLAVGEETGQTDTVLIKVADFYEEEVDLAIDSLGSVIEPIMIIIMGSMVGLIAASVMLPIAQLSQNIQ